MGVEDRMTSDPTTAREDETPRCIQCNYALAGLDRVGTCPECGARFGASLVIEGREHPDDSRTGLIIMGVILLGIGILMMYASGMNGCGLPFLVITVIVLVIQLIKGRTRRELGYDLRWVVDQSGIQVIRGKGTRIPLLPWSAIRSVRMRRGFGLFSRSQTQLSIRRRFLSMDMVRRRGQLIWIEGASDDPRLQRLCEDILAYRETNS